jgi:hypothetical protein
MKLIHKGYKNKSLARGLVYSFLLKGNVMSNNEKWEGYDDFILESSIDEVNSKCVYINVTIDQESKLYLLKKNECLFQNKIKHQSFEQFETLLGDLNISFRVISTIEI